MAKGDRRIDRRVVAQLGQPVLRRRATEVDPAVIPTPEFQQFIDKMHAVLETAGGVGLAAPQIFDGRRVFLAAILPAADEEDPPVVETLVNPTLSELSAKKIKRWEGCLSFIELLVNVPRHASLRVDYLDRTGAAKSLSLSGFAARVVQHENDHLDGVLTIDRAESPTEIVKASEYDDVFGSD
jgi:peptide deformylase